MVEGATSSMELLWLALGTRQVLACLYQYLVLAEQQHIAFVRSACRLMIGLAMLGIDVVIVTWVVKVLLGRFPCHQAEA